MKTDRLLKVTENMHKMGLKQLLISAPNSIFYLTGKFIHPGERMVVLSVLENGDVTLFANRLFAVGGIEGAKLIEYDDTDDCIKVLSEGVVSGSVGFDKEWACRFALPLMERRNDIKASIGSPAVDRARMLKTGEEIELILPEAVGRCRIEKVHVNQLEEMFDGDKVTVLHTSDGYKIN